MQKEPCPKDGMGHSSSLWADLGAIMMDGIVDLSYGFAKLDFINSTSNLVIIKPGQIVVMAIQVDSVEMLPDIESDHDKSITSNEYVLSCVEKKDNFLYPCIMSDKVMDAEEEFDGYNRASLARPQHIQREKG